MNDMSFISYKNVNVKTNFFLTVTNVKDLINQCIDKIWEPPNQSLVLDVLINKSMLILFCLWVLKLRQESYIRNEGTSRVFTRVILIK